MTREEINGLNERITDLKMQYQEAERINLKSKAGELLADINYLEELRELRSKQEPKTGSLDDAREDFMHDVYNELDFLPTNEEANRIIDSFDMVAKGIKQEPRWIPVSERLPEEEGLYLVTRRNTDDVATFIFRRTITSEDYWKRCATAWMPLPEPYKAESEV